jgi:hypothetical protein
LNIGLQHGLSRPLEGRPSPPSPSGSSFEVEGQAVQPRRGDPAFVEPVVHPTPYYRTVEAEASPIVQLESPLLRW